MPLCPLHVAAPIGGLATKRGVAGAVATKRACNRYATARQRGREVSFDLGLVRQDFGQPAGQHTIVATAST